VSAGQVYEKVEVFRQQTGNLTLIVNMYNNMVTSMLPVEAPLVKGHFDKRSTRPRPGASAR
jgi:hypothetical protein